MSVTSVLTFASNRKNFGLKSNISVQVRWGSSTEIGKYQDIIYVTFMGWQHTLYLLWKIFHCYSELHDQMRANVTKLSFSSVRIGLAASSNVEVTALFLYKIILVPDFAWLACYYIFRFTLTLQIEAFKCDCSNLLLLRYCPTFYWN